MNGVRVYKKNTLTEWQRPAFSVLSGIIKKGMYTLVTPII